MEYSKSASIFIEGTLIAQANDVEFNVDSGDSQVFTLSEGLAGHSDGASVFDATFQSAIPEAGFEQDWLGIVYRHETKTFSIRLANKQYEVRGRFMKAAAKSAVNAPNSVALTFNGRLIGALTI